MDPMWSWIESSAGNGLPLGMQEVRILVWPQLATSDASGEKTLDIQYAATEVPGV